MRVGGAAHAHTIRPTRGSGARARNSGPTREVSDPRAKCRTHARGEERPAHTLGFLISESGPRTRRGTQAARARSEQFRMQFD